MFGSKSKSKVKFKNLNKVFTEYESTFLRLFNLKTQKSNGPSSVTYVLKFNGDVFARQVQKLRDEISAIIYTSKSTKLSPDGYRGLVIIKLDSPGGTVTGYGLVAEQIKRLRKHNFRVIVTVDQVAASGGYMAAVCADEIVVAPSAVIGSIGVVSSVPNYTELLDKVGVKYKDYTAGKFKRTVTPYSNPTPEAEEHFESRLEAIHEEFKAHIKYHRPNVDVDEIGTGEHWSGLEAKKLGLVDHIGIYDEILMDAIESSTVVEVYHEEPKKGLFGGTAAMVVDRFFDRIEHSIESKLFNSHQNMH